MFAASKSGSIAAKDTKFNYVTMLLHGDGTNGAQNNTFLDSSTNNFTITRNGNTTQGTFSPYGSNWSNYFNASASRLEVVNSNSSMIAQGTAFTLEAWVFINTSTATGNTYNTSFPFLCSSTSSSSVSNGRLYSFGTTTFGFWDRASASWLTISWTPPVGQWFHLALVSTGTVFTLYINGTSVGSVTDNTTYYADSGYNFYIASYVGNGTAGSPPIPNMYISNFRYTKAQVYTSSFTPSTSPLTAITNTTVLTCQSNRFIDNSTNAYTVNPLGTTTPSVQRFSPFNATSAYSTSVIGGSGYFDGTGDYLNLTTNSSLGFGLGTYTAECWVYASAAPAYSVFFEVDTGGLQFGVNASANIAIAQQNIAFTVSSTTPIPLNTWSHIAVSRDGSNRTRIYLNGVQIASATDATNYLTGTTAYINNNTGNANKITGYIADLRVLKGTALYTSAFTPPSSPLTAITNTSLLLSYTNAGILDNAMMNDLETVGNAQISTSVKKYGTGSLAFDGAGDYLDSAAGTVNAIGSGDWTIEFWLYLNALTGTNIIDYRSASVLSNTLCVNYSSGMQLYVNNTTTAIQGSALSTSTWYHVAVCKSGSSTKMFVNGTQAGSTYTDTNNYVAGANRPRIGSGGDAAGNYLNGYIDDLRITKGFARYTANFTPPTAAFPNN